MVPPTVLPLPRVPPPLTEQAVRARCATLVQRTFALRDEVETCGRRLAALRRRMWGVEPRTMPLLQRRIARLCAINRVQMAELEDINRAIAEMQALVGA